MELKKSNRRLNTVLLMLLMAVVLIQAGCSESPRGQSKWLKDYGDELEKRGLFSQAVDSYSKHMLSPGVSDSEKSAISIHIAEIYKNKILDYDNAAAYYIAARMLADNEKAKKELAENVAECLELTGRTSEAARERNPKSEKDSSLAQSGAKIVARIGTRKITDADLDRMLASSYQQPDKMSRASKLDFLRGRLAHELMAQEAISKGYDKVPLFLIRMDEYRRALLAKKVYQDEVLNTVRVEPEGVRYYYEMNKKEFTDEKGNVRPFEAVAPLIHSKLSEEYQKRAGQDYLNRLLSSQDIEVYEENITGAPDRSAPRQPQPQQQVPDPYDQKPQTGR